ncbi:hypothetical protein J3R83DRAFT_886 [Lanmaoa asiatica]|nr:hypothetical protein J3R83DRAFT_886 [Lanmaoa asiatica]
MDEHDFRESAILSYIGLPPEYEPRPSSSPIEFLQKHLRVLPPHLIVGFSSVTTPKQRSVIAGIRNRRLAYTETKPKHLAFAEASNRWPHLWSGQGRHGQEAAQEEREWAEKGFLGGGAQQVGKLGSLLADYEEEREAERTRQVRRQRASEEFVPEEEDSESELSDQGEESPEEERAMFERRIKELFIYGMLEGADYELADWSEQYDVEDDREEEHLTSDIQRALQLAVGEANNPFIRSQSLRTSKKKRTRNDSAEDADLGSRDKKRKTRKTTCSPDGPDSALVNQASASQDSNEPSKKDKGKAKEVAHLLPAEINQQDVSVDSQHASSAAFLNAVVAAASATSDAQPMEIVSYQATSPFQDQQILPDQPSPYIHYPPVHYGFHDPSQFGQPPPQGHPIFPGLGSPLPDFHFASNDDIIRALQDMDVSRIASVLKSLGDAAAANASANNPSAFVPPLPPLPATTIVRPQPQVDLPSTSTSTGPVLSSIPKSTKSSHKRVLDMSLPGPEQSNPEHAHILANKWMNASKLAELVKTQGLVYKKGKFSAIEEQQLKNAMEAFKASRGLTDEQILEIIFQKNEKGKENAFWSEITAAIPQRPIIAVYHHVRRAFHPKKQQGKWLPEEDNLLRRYVTNHSSTVTPHSLIVFRRTRAVTDLGQQWEKVSEIVGRMSSDCRDRYRNHIANREVRVTGPWSKEEEEELTKIVTEMTVNQGKDFDNDVFWGIVSEKMGNRRGRQQCRIKWLTDSLSKTVKNEGQKPRWSPQDAYILVHKVDSLKVRDDTEIDWKTLPDSDWNLWSAHSLQRRWLTMKRSIKGYEEMTHQEIMDILRVKKAHLPPASSARRRKVTSAASVDDQDGLPDPGLASTNIAFQTSVAEVGSSESTQDKDSTESSDDEE